MSEVSVNIICSPALLNKMRRLADLDRQPEMAAAKKQIAALALQHQRRHFVDSSLGRGRWKALSPVTVIMRRRGDGIKLRDDSDVDRAAGKVAILRDTGVLLASLTPGAAGNINELLPRAVRIGTNLAYARKLHRGGASTFQFGEEEEKRFERNAAKTLPGFRAPRALKSGLRREWKARGKDSPWNPWFFAKRGALRKMAGRNYRIPARPIVRKPAADEKRAYCTVLAAAFKRITG